MTRAEQWSKAVAGAYRDAQLRSLRHSLVLMAAQHLITHSGTTDPNEFAERVVGFADRILKLVQTEAK